jgi:hypothetical protein
VSRYIRKTVILAKIQPTPLTDSVPVGATDAILVSNVTINQLNAKNVDRALIKPYFGGSQQLVGEYYVEASFDVELAGSGTAGTAPAWGALVRGCAMAETITAGVDVEYNPISDALEALTIHYHVDGVLHTIIDAKGTFDLKATVGIKPVFSFKFIGLYGGISAVTNPNSVLTTWITPQVINSANSGNVMLGCSYATEALSGGTMYPSTGLDVTLANTTVHNLLLGGDSIDITDRVPTGKLTLDLSATQHVNFMSNIQANNLSSMGFTHGTTAGNQILFYAPAVQLTTPAYVNQNGRALVGMALRFTPLLGNDEIKLVVK